MWGHLAFNAVCMYGSISNLRMLMDQEMSSDDSAVYQTLLEVFYLAWPYLVDKWLFLGNDQREILVAWTI